MGGLGQTRPREWETGGVLDERWIRSLHVETLREEELHAEREAHVLFQASTIAALLEGAYDGDLSFAELAEHGDLGLGTLNGLDGEMIALDGRFYRADVDGRVGEVDGAARTPFAVVTRFEPTIDARIEGPLDHEGLLSHLDELIPAGAPSCAIRLDGHFDLVRARSVPRQSPPYRPLTEVVAEQHVFELADVRGTMLGFRFPDYAEGIEVSGLPPPFHRRGPRSAAVTCSTRASNGLRVRLDPSNDLHVELPPGVELADPDLAAETHAAVELVERAGLRPRPVQARRPSARRSASQRSQSQSACSPPLRATTMPSGPPSTVSFFHRVELGMAPSASATAAGASFAGRTLPSLDLALKTGVAARTLTSLRPSPSRTDTCRPCRSPLSSSAPRIFGPTRPVTRRASRC